MQDEFYKKLDKFIDIVNQVNMEYEKQRVLSQSEKIINTSTENEPIDSIHHETISNTTIENQANYANNYNENNASATNLPENPDVDTVGNITNFNLPIEPVQANIAISTNENKTWDSNKNNRNYAEIKNTIVENQANHSNDYNVINDNQPMEPIRENVDVNTIEIKQDDSTNNTTDNNKRVESNYDKITDMVIEKVHLKSSTENTIDNNSRDKHDESKNNSTINATAKNPSENINTSNIKNKPGESSHDNLIKVVVNNQHIISNREHVINSTKKTVDRLLVYAAKNPKIMLDGAFLTKTVPVLRKDSKDFSIEDEIILWSSYHELVQLVTPATDYSILIAHKLNKEMGASDPKPKSWEELFKFWKQPKSNLCKSVNKCILELAFIVLALIVSIIIYILIQSYCGALSTALTESDNIFKEWQVQQNLSAEVKIDQANDQGNMKFSLILLNYQYAASLRVLVDITQSFLNLTHLDARSSNLSTLYCKNLMSNAQDPVYLTTCHTFQKNYANLLYIILSQYLLPLILGIVGSTAYIVRSVLDQLQTNSYLPAAQGKLTMRIFLGGLLGVITGIFISSGDSNELHKFNLNLVMLSLIMGYSVDVAFSLFDRIVERMNEWIDALKPKKKDTEKS